ncbi:MAG: hypothetical protein HC905_08610 [Bacteroidales bacterium]|nr:hypothetical protein [Bacteroidales bacterium]
MSITEDGEDNLWIGTWEGGISIFNPATQQFRQLPFDATGRNGIANSIAWATLADNNGNIWWGMPAKFLQQYNINTNSYLAVEQPQLDLWRKRGFAIYGLLHARDKYYWIATDDGLIRSNSPDAKTEMAVLSGFSRIYNGYIRALCEDKEGNIWAGIRNNGLLQLFRREQNFEVTRIRSGNINNQINDILDDDQGTLYFATDIGLYKQLPGSKSFTPCKVRASTPGYYWYKSLLRDDKGDIYAGTALEVLKLNRRSDVFEPWFTLPPVEGVYSMDDYWSLLRETIAFTGWVLTADSYGSTPLPVNTKS